MLLAAYSLGIGVPFVITGFSVGLFMKFFEKYRKLIRAGEIVAGVFLVLLGLLMVFNNLAVLAEYMPEWMYKFAK